MGQPLLRGQINGRNAMFYVDTGAPVSCVDESQARRFRLSSLMLDDNTPVKAGDLELDSLLTVFPEGAVGAADSQTLLIRVPPEALHLDPSRAGWAPALSPGSGFRSSHRPRSSPATSPR